MSAIDENSGGGMEGAAENEMEILGDQDETSVPGLPDAEDEVMGGMGTGDDFGLAADDFARGEIDVAEQMARTSAAMEKAGGRLDGHLTHVPHKHISNDDAAPSANPSTPMHKI